MAPAKNEDKNKKKPIKQIKGKKKKKRTPYSNDSIARALKDIREKNMCIRQVCRNYEIPRSTIQDRLAGRRSDIIKKPGPDPLITHEGEQKIVDWLTNIEKCGFPLKKTELLDTAQKVIQDTGKPNSFNDDRPGQTWYQNFLRRHPGISQRFDKSMKKERAQVTEESVRLWFRELHAYLVDSNHQDILESPERIFNGDVSGFEFCLKTEKVLGPKWHRNLYQIQNGSKKNTITVLVTLNANAQICPPLVVYPYVHLKQLSDSMPPAWVLGNAESGWMGANVFFEYVTVDFNNWVESNNIKKPVLLLVDGHKSHMSLVLSDMCKQMGIILYALPPNTSMFQPADVSVIAPLRSHWKSAVTEYLTKADNTNSSVTKTNFCAFFRDVIESPHIQQNIINEFGKCGLYPFDPDAVEYNRIGNKIKKVKILRNTTDETDNINEITHEDLVSARKVLKYLKPSLAAKNINVIVILNAIKKLEQGLLNQNDEYETCSDRSNSMNDVSE